MIKNNEQSKFNIDEEDYNRDMAELQHLREKYEKEEAMDSSNKRKEEEMLKGLRNNEGNQVLRSISWIMFAITLVPFLPYKFLLSAVGITTGYLHMADKKGNTKAPFIANIIITAIRAILWALIMLLLYWWPMLLS